MISNVLSVEDWYIEILVIMNIRDFEMTTICLEKDVHAVRSTYQGLSKYVTTV